MALTLPGWLVQAMSYIGQDFPQSNEDVLHQWADHIRSLSTTSDNAHAELIEAVSGVARANKGPGTDAFVTFMDASDSDAAALRKFSAACDASAVACDVCATAVVVLKGVVLFQLALLAPALLAGPVSFLLKQGVERAIEYAIGQALSILLEG